MNSIYIALWEYDIYFFILTFFQLLPRQKFIEQMSLQKKQWQSSSHSSRWLELTAKKQQRKEKA